MPRPLERLAAVLCYTAAMRVPIMALMLPGWAFTIPSGLLITAAVWLYARRRSPFLRHHARKGFEWSVLSNLILAGLTLLVKGLYFIWFYTGFPLANALWHLGGAAFRWSGILVTILTVFAMYRAARGETKDALTLTQ